MPRKKGGGGETLWCLPAKVERFSCVSWRRSLRSLKRNSQVKSVTTTRCHNLARSKRFELIRWGLLRLTNMSETVTAPRLTQTWRRGRLGCSVSQVPPLFSPPSLIRPCRAFPHILLLTARVTNATIFFSPPLRRNNHRNRTRRSRRQLGMCVYV